MIHIALFGGLRLVRGDDTLAEFSSQKVASLLALLALRPGRQWSREELIEALWPEVDSDSGGVRLRTLLSDLRAILEPERAVRGQLIVANRTIVSLDAEQVTSDVAQFTELLGRASREQESDSRIRLLEDAIQICREPLLPAHLEEWVHSERDRLAEERFRAMRQLAAALRARGRIDEGIQVAVDLVRENRLSEESYELLMRLYGDSGQTSAALRCYASLEKMLREDLDVEPGRAVRELVASIRRTGADGTGTPKCVQNPSGGHMPPDERIPAGEPSSVRPPDSPALVGLSTPVPIAPPSPAQGRPGPRRIPGPLMAVAIIILATAGGAGRFKAVRHPAPQPSGAIPRQIEPAVFWYQRDPGESHGDPRSMAFDEAGNLIVAGFVRTPDTDVDYLTVKFNPEGRQLWKRRHNGPGNDVDRARFAATDVNGNVYVTGDSDNGKGNDTTNLSGLDIVTICYGESGEERWKQTYNSPDNGEDRPMWMWLDRATRELTIVGSSVVGGRRNAAAHACIVVVRYGGDGKVLWRATFDDPHDAPSYCTGAIMDGDGNLTLTGVTHSSTNRGIEEDILLLKCSPAGKLLWKTTYGQRNGHDDTAVSMEFNGGALAIGRALLPSGEPDQPAESRFGTLFARYAADGRPVWLRGTTDPRHRFDRLVSAHPGPTVLGRSSSAETGIVHRLMRLDQSGVVDWVKDLGLCPKWLGTPNPLAITDEYGFVYTACPTVRPGRDPFNSESLDIAIEKVTPAGGIAWQRRFGEENTVETAGAIAMDSHVRGNLYVAAQSKRPDSTPEMVILKYRR